MDKRTSSIIRKFTYAETRAELRLYWSKKTVQERLAAMTEVTRRLQRMRGLDVEALNADGTVSRVCRERD